MAPKKTAGTLAALAIALLPLTTASAETPRGLWIKMKCALCHGEDGAGNTPAGKQKGAPDLRTEEVQKLSDDELIKPVVEGHAGIPPMQVKVTRENSNLLVTYIRSLAPKKK
ncbi:MAG: c-type cytochrome [Thermoanaerobaculia bacterium]